MSLLTTRFLVYEAAYGLKNQLMTLQDMHLVLNLIVKGIYEIESMKKVTFLPVMGLFWVHFQVHLYMYSSYKSRITFTEAFLVPATIYPPGFDRVVIDL